MAWYLNLSLPLACEMGGMGDVYTKAECYRQVLAQNCGDISSIVEIQMFFVLAAWDPRSLALVGPKIALTRSGAIVETQKRVHVSLICGRHSPPVSIYLSCMTHYAHQELIHPTPANSFLIRLSSISTQKLQLEQSKFALKSWLETQLFLAGNPSYFFNHLKASSRLHR